MHYNDISYNGSRASHKVLYRIVMTKEFKLVLAVISAMFVCILSMILFLPTLGHSWKLFEKLGYFYNGRVEGWHFSKPGWE